MEARSGDAISALRWGLGQYAWLFAAYLVAFAVVVPVVASRGSASYDAEALVVAQRLDTDLVALPRYGEAVFDNGEVARVIAAQFGDADDFEDIVPRRVSLVAEQDSIVLRVVGHDAAPETAAQLANVAAVAFLAELNGPGEGVGAFTIQSEAVPPAEPTDTVPGLPFIVPVGLVAGAILGLATVALIVVARRPVLEGADAEDTTGVPVLGSVTLPRTRNGAFPPAADVVGIVPLCRRLVSLGADVILLVGTPRSSAARDHVAVAAAEVLGRVCDVRLVAPAEVREAARVLARAEPTAIDLVAVKSSAGRRQLTIVDSGDSADLIAVDPSAPTVLLVPRGISVRSLRDAVGEHLGGGPAGLVLVRRSRRPSRRRAESVVPDEVGDDVRERPEPVQASVR